MKRFRKDITLIYKGLKEIHRIRPWIIALITFHSIFQAVTPFINIYMSAVIVDGITAGKKFNTLIIYAFIAVLLNLIIALSARLINRIINLMRAEFEQKYEMILSKKIIEMDYANVENPETHRLRQKMDEIRNMNSGGIWRLFFSFKEIIRCIFIVAFSIALTFSLFTNNGSNTASGIYSFIASPVFTVILGICIIANVLISIHTNATATKKMYIIMNDVIPFNRIYGYYLNNYISTYNAGKDIRIYNQKDLIQSEIIALIDDCNTTIGKLTKSQMKYSSISTISAVVISTLVYLFVGLRALSGLFGVGSIVKYVGSINEFIDGFTGFMNKLTMLRANNECLKLYFDYLNIPSNMYQGTLPVEKRSDNEYEIEFRNVSFKYPQSETYALRNVSLKLKIGERLAVVGMNGSGKTTFIKLLCRLYDSTEGEILLNGINIKKYNYNEYLSLFSVVFQDLKLFSFSLGQNVAACVDYDKERVEKCLEEAGFGDRYKEMENSTETCLYKDFDKKGVEISGGEAQKIVLARALYKNAPFIILDEPILPPLILFLSLKSIVNSMKLWVTKPQFIFRIVCPPAGSATTLPYSMKAGLFSVEVMMNF